jgi:hypothetical protein
MGSLKMGLAFWENGCIALPFFEPCSYTWKDDLILNFISYSTIFSNL